MTDEQRAGLAKEHLEKANALIDTLISAGAEELEGTRENLTDVIGVLEDLEFEEGSLAEGMPLPVSASGDDEEEEEDIPEFREDQEEE